jgi:hypothetical protein
MAQCGESDAIGGPPRITNGVMDALAEFGITQLTTPLTPQKVWKAIRSRPLLKRNTGSSRRSPGRWHWLDLHLVARKPRQL